MHYLILFINFISAPRKCSKSYWK